MRFAGGGVPTGQVIGATDRRGEDVTLRRVGPADLLATIYRHLGIDFRNVHFPDFSFRVGRRPLSSMVAPSPN